MVRFVLLVAALLQAMLSVETSADSVNILKVEPTTNSINVLASTSHNYIGNTSPEKIAVLFDITTLNDTSNVETNSIRQPYELAIVLDRSGSMSGSKLKQAKLAIISILDNMIDGDIIHIVQYDHDVQVLVENGYYGTRNEIIKKVNSIYCGGATNLFGGLSTAHNIIKNNINKDITHSRIFLFSDGLLNSGITDQTNILNHVSNWKNHLDLTISSFGIGYDFDRNLMTAIAERGKGDFFFIDSAESTANIVDIARKDAASIVGTDAVLTIKAMNASQSNVEIVIKTLFDRELFGFNKYCKFNQIDIRDLRCGDSKYVIVELSIDPKVPFKGDEMPILEWILEYKDVVNSAKYNKLSGRVDVKVVEEKDDKLQSEENINEHIKVFWKLNELRVLDKQVLDAIENEEYDVAVRRRKILNLHSDSLRQSDSYDRFKMDPTKVPSLSPTTMSFSNSFFTANEAIVRRMRDDNIQRQMDDLEDKMNKKQKISKKQKETLLMDAQTAYSYSAAPSSMHDEL